MQAITAIGAATLLTIAGLTVTGTSSLQGLLFTNATGTHLTVGSCTGCGGYVSGTVGTLQLVTDAGATTDNAIVFAGGTSTGRVVIGQPDIENQPFSPFLPSFAVYSPTTEQDGRFAFYASGTSLWESSGDVPAFDIETHGTGAALIASGDVYVYAGEETDGNLSVQGNLTPRFNNQSSNIGSSSRYWNDVYSTGTINANFILADSLTVSAAGPLQALGGLESNGATLGDTGVDNLTVSGEFSLNDDLVTSDFSPKDNASYDLGNSSKKWKDGWFSGNMSIAGNVNVSGTTYLTNLNVLGTCTGCGGGGGSVGTLQQVTDSGNQTTKPIQFSGGTSTLDLYAQSFVSDSFYSRLGASTMGFNIPISGIDAATHDINFSVNSRIGLSVEGIGNGAGGADLAVNAFGNLVVKNGAKMSMEHYGIAQPFPIGTSSTYYSNDVNDFTGGIQQLGFTGGNATAYALGALQGTVAPTVPAIELFAAKSNGAGGFDLLTATEKFLGIGTAALGGSDFITIYGDGRLVSDAGAQFGGSLTVNGGLVQANLVATSTSIGGGLLTAGTCASATTTVTGATNSMAVVATPVTYPGDGSSWLAYVSNTNEVTTKVCGLVTVTPTASTYKIRVLP